MRETIIEISKKAESLLRSAFFTDKFISQQGKIHPPIPVLNSDESINSWFVAIVMDQLLAGFFQFSNELEVMRYSSFQRQAGSLDGCPKAYIWLDKERMMDRAKKEMKNNEEVSEPYLTYDSNPFRIVWAVSAISSHNKRRIYVAGNYVYTK